MEIIESNESEKQAKLKELKRKIYANGVYFPAFCLGYLVCAFYRADYAAHATVMMYLLAIGIIFSSCKVVHHFDVFKKIKAGQLNAVQPDLLEILDEGVISDAYSYFQAIGLVALMGFVIYLADNSQIVNNVASSTLIFIVATGILWIALKEIKARGLVDPASFYEKYLIGCFALGVLSTPASLIAISMDETLGNALLVLVAGSMFWGMLGVRFAEPTN